MRRGLTLAVLAMLPVLVACGGERKSAETKPQVADTPAAVIDVAPRPPRPKAAANKAPPPPRPEGVAVEFAFGGAATVLGAGTHRL